MQSDLEHEVSIKWFARTLLRYVPLYLEVIVIAICLRLLMLVEPFVFQVLIDRVLPFQREASLVAITVVLAFAAVAHIGFDVLLRILNTLCANRVSLELSERVFSAYTRLPLATARQWKIGETIARIEETETIHGFLAGTSIRAILDLAFVVVYIGILFALSQTLALIVLVALPVNAAIYFGMGPILRRKLRARFEADAAYQSATVETVAGFTTVRALGEEDRAVSTLASRLKTLLRRGFELEIVRLISDNAIYSVERIITVGIVFVGASLVFANEMTLGQLVAFHLLSAKVVQPVANFARLWEDWQNVRISRQRLGEIVQETNETKSAKPAFEAEDVPTLELRDVAFSYENKSEVLKCVNASWQAKSLNLIVGPSGAGKSTLGRLAAGLEEPTKGVVTLNNENICQFADGTVRKQVAYVQQDSFLFEGTVRSNLLQFDDGLGDQRIKQAFAELGFEAFESQLPLGLDTNVGERGAALSGGQRQKVAIARAYLRGAKVLILDEPTSALDPSSRCSFANALEKLKSKMTIIVVTHNADAFSNVDSVTSLGGVE